MSLFIIWATVAFNGEATNLEYQGGLFKTHEKCIEYLTKEESYVLETLNKHINNKYPNGKVLMLACGARSNFEKYDFFLNNLNNKEVVDSLIYQLQFFDYFSMLKLII